MCTGIHPQCASVRFRALPPANLRVSRLTVPRPSSFFRTYPHPFASISVAPARMSTSPLDFSNSFDPNSIFKQIPSLLRLSLSLWRGRPSSPGPSWHRLLSPTTLNSKNKRIKTGFYDVCLEIDVCCLLRVARRCYLTFKRRKSEREPRKRQRKKEKES